jgi:hypothetical protein
MHIVPPYSKFFQAFKYIKADAPSGHSLKIIRLNLYERDCHRLTSSASESVVN